MAAIVETSNGDNCFSENGPTLRATISEDESRVVTQR